VRAANRLKAVIGLLVVCCAPLPAMAVQQISPDNPLGFTCNSSFGTCACDGSYENCNAMEQSCKDRHIACTLINNQMLCTCLMARKINATPNAGNLEK
jgi:hypothetical protein